MPRPVQLQHDRHDIDAVREAEKLTHEITNPLAVKFSDVFALA